MTVDDYIKATCYKPFALWIDERNKSLKAAEAAVPHRHNLVFQPVEENAQVLIRSKAAAHTTIKCLANIGECRNSVLLE